MSDPKRVLVQHPNHLPRVVTYDTVGNLVIETYLDLLPGIFNPIRTERVVVPVEIRAALAEAIRLPDED